jgi:hypothetical protein
MFSRRHFDVLSIAHEVPVRRQAGWVARKSTLHAVQLDGPWMERARSLHGLDVVSVLMIAAHARHTGHPCKARVYAL